VTGIQGNKIGKRGEDYVITFPGGYGWERDCGRGLDISKTKAGTFAGPVT